MDHQYYDQLPRSSQNSRPDDDLVPIYIHISSSNEFIPLKNTRYPSPHNLTPSQNILISSEFREAKASPASRPGTAQKIQGRR